MNIAPIALSAARDRELFSVGSLNLDAPEACWWLRRRLELLSLVLPDELL